MLLLPACYYEVDCCRKLKNTSISFFKRLGRKFPDKNPFVQDGISCDSFVWLCVCVCLSVSVAMSEINFLLKVGTKVFALLISKNDRWMELKNSAFFLRLASNVTQQQTDRLVWIGVEVLVRCFLNT